MKPLSVLQRLLLAALLAAGTSQAADYPLALRPVALPEFGAVRGSIGGLRIGAGESHRLQFELAAGVLVSVATASDGDLDLSLLDPRGDAVVERPVGGARSVVVALRQTETAGLWCIGLHNGGAGEVTVACEVVANAAIAAGSIGTMAQAQDLGPGLRPAAAGTCAQVAALGSIAGDAGAADWFRFRLAEPARVEVLVRQLGGGIPQVLLADGSGAPVPGGTSSPLPPGDYFVKVSGAGARYGLGLIIGGSLWPALVAGLEGGVLGYMPPSPSPVETSAFVADFGDNNSHEAAVAGMIKAWSPEFIFTGGDNIYAGGDVGVGVSEWQTKVGNYYGEFIQARANGSYPELASPLQRFFPSVGNQDGTIVLPGGGSIAGYLDYFHDNPGGAPRLPSGGGAVHSAGESFYRVRNGAVELFVLDTDHARQDPASMVRQRDWVRAALAGSGAPWRFVIAHHPPYSSANANGGFAELRWLETLDADVIFSGDSHIYERLETAGPLALICGIGGRSLARFSSGIAQSRFHFDAEYGALRIDATPDAVSIALRTVDDGGGGLDGGREIERVSLGAASGFVPRAVADLRPRVAATLTPPLASGAANVLDLKLRLLGDGQATIAEDEDSAPDGRNARLLIPVGSAASGTIEIARQSAVGGPFEIVFLEPYAAWLLDLGAPAGADTSPGGDPDGDHLSNWFEYATGSDPFRYSQPVAAALDPGDPAGARVTFPQRADAAERGISYAIEVSGDLVSWSPVGGANRVGELSPGIEQWQATVPITRGPVFARMRATAP